MKYYCNKKNIDKNTQGYLDNMDTAYMSDISIFPDVHFVSNDSIPVGVSFETSKDIIYPLVSGKDIGCGVAFCKISKKDFLKKIDKHSLFKSLYREHFKFTNDGLGGGNHFLEIGENENWIFITCHTGSRNRGIYLYQKMQTILNDYRLESGKDVNYIEKQIIPNFNEFFYEYQDCLNFASNRRKYFIHGVIKFLQRGKILRDGGLFLHIHDSCHNYISFDDVNTHRKGVTGLDNQMENRNLFALPISMKRGVYVVKYDNYSNGVMSCSHGAGRKMSRGDAYKHYLSLKPKLKKRLEGEYSEFLKNGKFEKTIIQEMDFAYKDDSDIFDYQPHIKLAYKVKPLLTIKWNEKYS